MKITYISAIYTKSPIFQRKLKADLTAEYNEIIAAIRVIATDEQYPLSLSSIVKITGLPYSIVYSRLYSKNQSQSEALKLWQEAHEIRGVSYSSGHPSEPQMQEKLAKNFEAIKKAIEQIEQDPNLKPTKAMIASLTGLSDGYIYNCFNYKGEYGSEITELWKNVLEKRGLSPIKNSGIKIAEASVFNDSVNKLKNKKTKDLKKAVGMIQQALNSGTRLSYKELETACGLNKDEVNELIKQYAKFKQEGSRLARDTKEQQAKWYEENKG